MIYYLQIFRQVQEPGIREMGLVKSRANQLCSCNLLRYSRTLTHFSHSLKQNWLSKASLLVSRSNWFSQRLMQSLRSIFRSFSLSWGFLTYLLSSVILRERMGSCIFLSSLMPSNNLYSLSNFSISFSYLVINFSQFSSWMSSFCMALTTSSRELNLRLRRECMFLHCSGVLDFLRKVERCLQRWIDRRSLNQSGRAWQWLRKIISLTFYLARQFLCQKMDSLCSSFSRSLLSESALTSPYSSISAQLLAPADLRRDFFISYDIII